MGTHDDLGAQWLTDHPRGEQWRELDVSVTAMTFPQVGALAAETDPDEAEDQSRRRARIAVIARLSEHTAGRLGSRWVRWCSTFGFELPSPEVMAAPDQMLFYPYELADRLAAAPDRPQWAQFARGLSAVFDAALGIAGAGLDPAGTAAFTALVGPWSRVCLPCRFGPGDVFGPGHSAALALLHSAATLPRAELEALAHRRDDLGERWQQARAQAQQRSTDQGYPFRADGLFWEAVAAAEDATHESPTNPSLADALWGAAAALVFADTLDSGTVETLTEPWSPRAAPPS